MEFKVGRLFFRAYRTRGPALQLRLKAGSLAELRIGRWLGYVAWLHRADCDCWPCAEQRWLDSWPDPEEEIAPGITQRDADRYKAERGIED